MKLVTHSKPRSEQIRCWSEDSKCLACASASGNRLSKSSYEA
uniref:Uncharacterized protein n=1 Tax=Anguilla anguilla TaxID=7936 RepID=A0A0E9QUB3_ANGAN